MADAELKSALRALIDARKAHALAEKREKDANAAKREAQLRVHELMTESGSKSERVDLGEGYGEFQFVPNGTIYGRVLDELTAVEAMRQEGLEQEILHPKIRGAQLNELVRERLETGQALPDGVDFYERKFVTVTKR